jgi:hypothetical protein
LAVFNVAARLCVVDGALVVDPIGRSPRSSLEFKDI